MFSLTALVALLGGSLLFSDGSTLEGLVPGGIAPNEGGNRSRVIWGGAGSKVALTATALRGED